MEMFKKEKGAEFVGINNYTSKKGELSNQTLNVGIDVLNAKKKDLKTLKGLSIEGLYVIADKVNVSHVIADKALAELLIAGTKNVSSEIENRTLASQSQTDAYIHINKGMKMLKSDNSLLISGFVISKKIIIKGEYKTVNSRDLTIIKNAIKNELDFKMNKYRAFIFKNAENYKINGNQIEIIKV